MTKLHILCSAALSIAAFSLPAMGQGQGQSHRKQHVGVVCNDGTVIKNNHPNACKKHSGVRAVSDDNHPVMNHPMHHTVGHSVTGKTLPTGNNTMQTHQGGLTTAQMMAELQIDHTWNNATARCQDGFYYHGQHVGSACSHDGGVSAWYK